VTVDLLTVTAVEVDHDQVSLGEIPLGQLLEQSFPRIDELARDLALGNADLLGHLGQNFGVTTRRDTGHHDVEHAIGQSFVLLQGGVGRDLDFAEFSWDGSSKWRRGAK
jgi:hypothetical protein